MNVWQGFAFGFLCGSLYVMFVLPWLHNKTRKDYGGTDRSGASPMNVLQIRRWRFRLLIARVAAIGCFVVAGILLIVFR